jgi:hypothetical protein
MKAGINEKAVTLTASKLLILKVGAIGFEPTTSRSRTEGNAFPTSSLIA